MLGISQFGSVPVPAIVSDVRDNLTPLRTRRFQYAVLVAVLITAMAVKLLPLSALVVLGGYIWLQIALLYRYSVVTCFVSLTDGNSMAPTIPGGVTLTLGYYPFAITEGDIIMYDAPPNVDANHIQHRVVRVTDEWIHTRGDNNPRPDWPIKREDVVAKTLTVGGHALYIPVSPRAIRATVENFRR